MNILVLTSFLTLAQTPASSSNADLQVHSLWEFVVKGGWCMIPIAICSLVALTVIVERAIVLRRNRVVPREFVRELRGIEDDSRRALEFCRANASPLANVLAAGIKNRGRAPEYMEKQMTEAGHRELVKLRQHMRLLSVLPQVSTMLGLLGTIFGMIRTFQAIAISGEALGKTERLAGGIYEAWTATASGLLIAVPVLIAYHILMGKIDNDVAALDAEAVDWLNHEQDRVTPETPSAADVTRLNGEQSSKDGAVVLTT